MELCSIKKPNMKAITYSNYGGPEVLQLQNITKPTPKANEILIKVYATSVTAGDARMRSFNVPSSQWIFARLYLGLINPRRPVLGMELSGVVEAIGNKVSRFKVGDEVFASTLNSNFGAYAEYKCLPETGAIAIKPANISFFEAATLPIGAGTALRLLKKADFKIGSKILIYGASGSVGTYAIQLAKFYGADITAICGPSSIDLIKSLNPNRIIDYTQEEIVSWGRYDLVFDAVGKMDTSKLKSLLVKGGNFVTVKSNPGYISANDLNDISQLVESNAVRPIITESYKLENVIDAHKLVDTGHKKGNVSIVVSC